MAKTNRQAHIRSAKRQRERQRRGKTNRTKLVIAWMLSPRRLVGATLALMTIAGTYYLFKSKVSLQPESPLKSDFVLDTPFLLSNESVLPIYNIKQGEWLIERHRYPITPSPRMPFSELSEVEPIQIPPEKNTISSLPGSQSVTLYPFDYMEDKTEKRIPKRIIMIVDITYQTAIFRWRRTQTFWFRGDMGADGIFHWYPTQESEVIKP